MAVEIGEMLADTRQVDKPVNGSQQMILRDVIVYRNLIKQSALCFLLWPQHRKYPQSLRTIESGAKPQINKSFSTKYTHTAGCCAANICYQGRGKNAAGFERGFGSVRRGG